MHAFVGSSRITVILITVIICVIFRVKFPENKNHLVYNSIFPGTALNKKNKTLAKRTFIFSNSIVVIMKMVITIEISIIY